MAKVVSGMTISVDGFVADRNGDISRLYSDFEAMHDTEWLQESMRDTKAVVMGRHAYDMANGDFTGYEFQCPIFVLTHHIPEIETKGQNENLKIHFVTDGIESAIQQAKAAAGDNVVTIVGGADTSRQALASGLVDELHVDIMPIVFGGGIRWLEQLDQEVKLEKIKVISEGERTNLMFRVVK